MKIKQCIKMRNVRTLTVNLVVTILFFNLLSCNDKDENDTPAPKTKTELLTSSPWITTAFVVDPAISVNGTLVSNILAQYDNCDKDDLVNYKSDKTYSYEEGLTKCNDNAPQVYETGTWSFNSDETILIETQSGGSAPFNMNLVSLSENELVINFIEEINGLNHTFTITRRHQ